MKHIIRSSLTIMAILFLDLSALGGSLTTNRIVRSNQIFPEFWDYWSPEIVNRVNYFSAQQEAEQQVTGPNYSAGWAAKGMDPINFSRTLAMWHWNVMPPVTPYWGTGIQRKNAYYTVDLRSFGVSNGYRQALFELRWNYAGAPTYSLSHTNYVPLALGQITQVRCFFWPGWYQDTLPNNYATWGFTWLDPEVALVKEEQDHQPQASQTTALPDLKVGDPIFVQSGNVSLDERDLSLPAPHIGLDFTRTYGSLNEQTGILGRRWTHSWDWQMSVSNTVYNQVTNEWVVLRRGDLVSFRKLNTPTNAGASAQAISDGFIWRAATNANGLWTVVMAGGLVASFGTNGLLDRLSDSWSNSVQVIYSNRIPQVLQHSSGPALTLKYANDLLWEISTPHSNLFQRYYYSTNGLLTNAVTFADGKSYSTTYQWNEASQVITQRINAVGSTRSWEYEGQKGARSWLGTNRWNDTEITYSELGDGRRWVIEYGEFFSWIYLWDFNAVFSKADQIIGPISDLTMHESSDNGTNIITLVFYPHGTNELVACVSNAYFQELDSTYNILDAAARNETYPAIQNTFDERGNMVVQRVEEYSVSGSLMFYLSHMGYDAQDRLTEFGFGWGTGPANYWSIAWEDAWHLPGRVTDPEGHEVSWAYTNGVVAKEAVQVSSGVSNETVFAYTTNGLLSAVTNANGHALRISYDASCNPTSVVFPETPTIEMTWTSLGYLDEIRLPSDSYDTNGVMAPRTTKFATDPRGFVNAVTWADGLTDSYYRCALGVVTSWVDRAGRRTDYGYLPSAKLSSVTRYLGSQPVTTRIDYDRQFNALKITDPLNRAVESYELDNQSRPRRISNVNSQTMEVSYFMGEMVNTIKRFDGTMVSNAYTGDGWLGAIRYPDETVSFGYFKNGLLKTASNPTGTITMAYNAAHQVLSVSNAVSKGLVSYVLDGLGQATSTVWNGIGITRGYTAGEQLNYVKVPTGDVFLSYNGLNGLLAGVSNAAGLTAVYSYNSMDQVTGIVWKAANGQVVRSWTYTRDALGFVTDVETESGEVSQYQYDGLDRLATAMQWNAAGELMTDERFAYDLAGNRTNKNSSGVAVDYVQDSGDWLTSWKVTTTDLVGAIDVYGVSSEAIGTNSRYGSLYVSNDVVVTPDVDDTNFSVYMLPIGLGTQQVVAAIRDMAGNMGYATGTVFLTIVTNGVYGIDPAGCVTNIKYTGVQYSNNRGIKWDGQYRIKEVLTNGASAERYGYDALGRRVLTVSGGVTNWHVYDGVHVLADTDATGGVLRVYGHGIGIDHLLTLTVYTSGSAKTYYYLTDHLGSVHALADEVGNVVESYRFDAWGKVTGVYDGNGNHLTESAYGNRFLWQGREYSYRTGLYHFRARWYDPVMGRWLSNDPIGIAGGLNQYVFCGNNPVNGKDPSGHFWGAVIAVEAVGVYTLNAPIPGIGRVLALTLPSTRITLVGWNYFRLDPLAQQIISTHEFVHSRQPFWWAIRHPILAEISAYQEQYCEAKKLMQNWKVRTHLPMGGKAWNDVNQVYSEAVAFLEAHGVTVSP